MIYKGFRIEPSSKYTSDLEVVPTAGFLVVWRGYVPWWGADTVTAARFFIRRKHVNWLVGVR